MALDFQSAEELRSVTEKVYRKWRTDLPLVNVADVALVWNKKQSNPGYYAKIRIVPDFFVALGMKPLLIEFWKHGWEVSGAGKRHFIILHELTHILKRPNGTYKLKPHDVEDFRELVRKTGLDYEHCEENFAQL